MEQQKKNPQRVSIFLDEAFAFGVHQDVLLQHHLYTGRMLDEAAIKEIIYDDQLVRAKQTALSYLAHRARTEYEVRDKLKKNQFDELIIERVIERLYELSYLDDDSFTERYIRGRLNKKGHAPLRLKADLRRMGISPEKIDRALQTIADRNSLLDKALEQAQKRSKRLARETDSFAKRRKIYGFLLRKGHTPDVANEVLERLEL